MIKLYVADITHLPNPDDCPDLLKNLPMERVLKIRRARTEKGKKQSMGAGLLLQKVLALCFDDANMSDFEQTIGDHGKPYIHGVEYNLSHSGDLVVCAVSDQPVGCDVEQVREAPKKIADRFFGEREKKYLEDRRDEDYTRGFFRLWTLKESYMKMTGEGMSLPLGSYEMILNEEVKVCREGRIQDCCFSEFEANGYRIAVCGMERLFVENIFYVKFE